MNWSEVDAALVPAGVVTVTSTVPVPAGAVTMICVEELTVYTALEPPKLTAVAPVKFVPVIVTDVPPASGPLDGLIVVTVGAGKTVI